MDAGFVDAGVQSRGLRSARTSICGHRSGSVRWYARMARPGPGGASKWKGKKVPSDKEFSTTITKTIDESFRKISISKLRYGIREADETALQHFILALMAAYKKGYSLHAIHLELSMSKVVDLKDTEAVPLKDEEKKTRFLWMKLVYMVLETVGWSSNRQQGHVPAEVVTTPLKDLVAEVHDAYQRGFSYHSYKMEMAMNLESGIPAMKKEKAMIQDQWMCIAFLTNKLVEFNLNKRRGAN